MIRCVMSACLCVVMAMSPLTAHAQSTTTQQHSTDGSVNASPQQTHARLDELLMSPDYSETSEEKRWRPKNPKPERKMPDVDVSKLERLFKFFEGLGQGMGVVGKTIAVGFLLVMAWLAYRTRETWLKWFSNVALRTGGTRADVTQTLVMPDEPLWAHLPDKHGFTAHLQALLAQGRWLQVLSLLYQGTLREISEAHTLPIKQGDTEDSCTWLLNHAKSASAKEQAYFSELVSLWRASAYGQKIPDGIAAGDYGSIQRLIQAWGALYGK